MTTKKDGLILCGGSFMKRYLPTTENHGLNFLFDPKGVHDLLVRANLTNRFNVTELDLKDSLFNTDNDRRRMALVAQRESGGSMIIHGSDTVRKTAEFLQNLKVLEGKNIVLVCSRRPLRERDTDAEINFGVGLGVLQHAGSGIRIVIDGKSMPWQEYNPDTI